MSINKTMDYEKQKQKILRLPDNPIPVVMDGNWVNSLGIIRGLADIGLQSIAINHDPDGVGLYSKYAIGLVGPNPRENPNGLIDLLIQISQEFKTKGILFVTDDDYLRVLSKWKVKLEPYYHFSFVDYPILERLLNKQEQYRAAEKVGIQYPQTQKVKSVADIKTWPEYAYPVIVKGTSGKDFYHHFHSQVIEIENRNALEDLMRNMPDVSVILQEKIPGGEENLYTCGCYMNKRSEAKAIFTGRKLRQYPRYFGTCTVGESVPCQEIIESSLRLLHELNFFGIAQVEYKRDLRDGSYKLIEINARFWKWHSLATNSGINLSAIAYRDILGLEPLPLKNQRYGLKWVIFPDDIRGIAGDIKAGNFKLVPWLRTISPPFVLALFDFLDPCPWFRLIWKLIKKALSLR